MEKATVHVIGNGKAPTINATAVRLTSSAGAAPPYDTPGEPVYYALAPGPTSDVCAALGGGGDHLLARISRSFWRARKFATSVLSETDSEGLPERRSRLTWLPSPPPLAKNPPAPTGDAPMPQLEPEARSGLPWRLLTTPLAPALKSPGTRAPAAASLVALSPCQEAAGASASRASRWRFRRGQMPQICGMRASIQPTARSRATKKMTA